MPYLREFVKGGYDLICRQSHTDGRIEWVRGQNIFMDHLWSTDRLCYCNQEIISLFVDTREGLQEYPLVWTHPKSPVDHSKFYPLASAFTFIPGVAMRSPTHSDYNGLQMLKKVHHDTICDLSPHANPDAQQWTTSWLAWRHSVKTTDANFTKQQAGA